MRYPSRSAYKRTSSSLNRAVKNFVHPRMKERRQTCKHKSVNMNPSLDRYPPSTLTNIFSLTNRNFPCKYVLCVKSKQSITTFFKTFSSLHNSVQLTYFSL